MQILPYPVFCSWEADKTMSGVKRSVTLMKELSRESKEVCKCGKSSGYGAGRAVACQMQADDSVTSEELFYKRKTVVKVALGLEPGAERDDRSLQAAR